MNSVSSFGVLVIFSFILFSHGAGVVVVGGGEDCCCSNFLVTEESP